MAKHNGNVETPATTEATAPVQETKANFEITYRRDHPGDRCSFGIAGVSGIIVFDKGMFADPANVPTTITLSVPLAQPRADKKASKAEEAAKKAADKAAKDADKVAKLTAKAEEKRVKAEEALAKAKAKAEAAAAKLTGAAPKVEGDAPTA